MLLSESQVFGMRKYNSLKPNFIDLYNHGTICIYNTERDGQLLNVQQGLVPLSFW